MSTILPPEVNAMAACKALIAWRERIRCLNKPHTDEISAKHYRQAVERASLALKQVEAEGRGDWLAKL